MTNWMMLGVVRLAAVTTTRQKSINATCG